LLRVQTLQYFLELFCLFEIVLEWTLFKLLINFHYSFENIIRHLFYYLGTSQWVKRWHHFNVHNVNLKRAFCREVFSRVRFSFWISLIFQCHYVCVAWALDIIVGHLCFQITAVFVIFCMEQFSAGVLDVPFLAKIRVHIWNSWLLLVGAARTDIVNQFFK